MSDESSNVLSERRHSASNWRTGSRALPNVIVIGAMKCGTSSMHAYLDAHPEVKMSRRKEINFFSHDDNWERGESWYEKHFSPTTKIRGESSPSYTKFPQIKNVPDRMHELIPDVKLIYLVRDPIERILSHYMHSRETGRESRSISDALSEFENNKYVDPSRYYLQLQRYSRFFAPTQILVVATEEMRSHRDETLRTVFEFLGVESGFRSDRHDAVYHVSRPRGPVLRALTSNRLAGSIRPYVPNAVVNWATTHGRGKTSVDRPGLPEHLGDALRDYLRADTDRFRAELDCEFTGWSV